MARKVPTYRKHQRGQAIVVVNGKTYYLGKHGTERSIERYKDVLAEHWNPVNKQRDDWPTVEELLARYLSYAKRYYSQSNEAEHIILAMRPLRKLFADVITREFTPRMLKAVREQMVQGGLSRQGANKRVTRLRRIFAWGVAEELAPESVYSALKTLAR